MKYIKTYTELFALVGRADAVLYSYILNQAEHQKTDTPSIEQTYLQQVFCESKYKISKSLQNLKNYGLIDYERSCLNKKGKMYTTTIFKLLYKIKENEYNV